MCKGRINDSRLPLRSAKEESMFLAFSHVYYQKIYVSLSRNQIIGKNDSR